MGYMNILASFEGILLPQTNSGGERGKWLLGGREWSSPEPGQASECTETARPLFAAFSVFSSPPSSPWVTKLFHSTCPVTLLPCQIPPSTHRMQSKCLGLESKVPQMRPQSHQLQFILPPPACILIHLGSALDLFSWTIYHPFCFVEPITFRVASSPKLTHWHRTLSVVLQE
jgi:hypothetical protein